MVAKKTFRIINILFVVLLLSLIVLGFFLIGLKLEIKTIEDISFKYKKFLIPFLLITCSFFILVAGLIHYSYTLYLIGKRFSYASAHDSLTELPNRESFIEKLSEMLNSNECNLGAKKKDFTLMLIDIDGFRNINDFNSHETGDFVLKTVASRLSSLFSEKERYFVSRHSVDKFMLLFTDIFEKDDPTILFYIRQALSTPIKLAVNENEKKTIQQKSIILRTSIGIVDSRNVGDVKTAGEYLSAADIAMNESKKLGKNKYVFFTPEMRKKIQENAKTALVIESACHHDGFTVAYQPQIDVKDGSIYGFEALVRMSYAKMGPGQFIPVAEEGGHIAKIGRIVTEKVVKQIAIWKKQGIPLHKISINYSFGQLEDKEYVFYLRNLLKAYEIPTSLIGIEITESLFMGNKEQAMEIFKQFSEMGIKIALDDFGTGYSSLSYLTYLPLEIVKIDKTLVDTYLKEDEDDSQKSKNFIYNIINLVHSLGMKLTIEGVEHEWQFNKLKSYGCDYIQGYFFSKPLIADEIENFILQRL